MSNPAKKQLKQFAAAINAKMDSCGINRVQLANRLKVHPSFVTKVLKCDTNVSINTLVGFSEALGFKLQIKLVKSR